MAPVHGIKVDSFHLSGC